MDFLLSLRDGFRALLAIHKAMGIDEATVITYDLMREERRGDMKIRYVPIWLFLYSWGLRG